MKWRVPFSSRSHGSLASLPKFLSNSFSQVTPSSGDDIMKSLVLLEAKWYGAENGTAYAGSYVGNHYDFTALGNVSLMFNKSSDGINWEPVDPKIPSVYRGGASEVGW